MIVIHSEFLYRAFGRKSDSAATVVCDFTTKREGADLNLHHSLSRDEIVANYIDAVGRLSIANAENPIWWATDLASKNRFISPLSSLINDLLRFRAADAAAQADGRQLSLRRPPWPIATLAQAQAEARGDRARIFAWPFARTVWRMRRQWSAWVALFKGAAVSILQIRLARRHYGPPPPTNKPVYLIKSFIYASDFDDAGRHRDAFFGRFPDAAAALLAPDAGVLGVVLGFEDKAACYTRLRGLTDRQVVPLESYLSTADVIGTFAACAWAVLRKGIEIPAQLPLFGFNAAPLVREVVAGGGWQLAFFQFLHGRAAENIARHHQLIGCAMTYELNPWERPFNEGLRRRQPDLPVFGFQHSIVTQAGTGIFLSRHETACAPLPDAILTTGRVPARIIATNGAFPSERIWPLGALRYETLGALSPVPRRARTTAFTVLVALEGVHPAVVLLEYALAQAAVAPNIRFRIRAHPVFPLDKMREMLPLSRRRFPTNVEESQDRSVHGDVADCDAVLYWGTTVALEAIMIGRPIIHFDRGDALSYDPLFELEIFHWTVRQGDPIAGAITEISALPDDKYDAQCVQAATYIKEYFIPVSENVISRAVFQTPAAKQATK